MKIVSINAFEGRNIYSHKKCVRLDVDLEGYCDTPSKDIANFNERLVSFIPELKTHRCGIDEEGGFVKRLKEGTYLSHICEHTIIALQNRLGIEVAYGKAREIEGDRYYIIYQYEYKNTAISIGKTAVELMNALIMQKNFDLQIKMQEIQSIFIKEQLGPSTSAICEEAKKRGIPVFRIGEGSMFQLGYGKYGKKIEATISQNTSAVAVDIACDKLQTKQILNMQCIPVAKGATIRTKEEVLQEAQLLGYPVVLKPRFGNQGKGVYVNLKNEKELLAAYNSLEMQYCDILLEQYIEGKDYRVCVVDGKVIAVAHRIPPYIIGDGKSTIKRLIEQLNKDERRGEGHEKPLTKIKIDEKLIAHLRRQGYILDSILPCEQRIYLRENANLSTGGIAIDCTDKICQENIEMCIRAAKSIGLDICGVDVSCNDIAVPLTKQGAIIEINAAPGIRMHHYPYEGKSRNVAGAILDMMFENNKSSIPIISVTGTNGKTTTTRLISYVLQLAGYKTGMTTTGGIYIDGKCIEKGDTTGAGSATTVLMNKDIDIAVLETARGGMIRQGLGYDLADVGVITNITEDHLGLDGIHTLEELAYVKSLVGEAVKEKGYVVLNAEDPMTLSILPRIKHKIIFYAKDRLNPYLRKNIQKGGIGVYEENGYICVENRKETLSLVKIENVGISLNGTLKYNIENAMAACAALVALGVDYTIIQQGLTDFQCNKDQNPGRFNLYEVGQATVILDYAHNMPGYKSVLQDAKHIPHKRLVGVIGVPGDRLDKNVFEVGKIAAEHFDFLYIKEDEDKRGRKPGEIAAILKQGVLSTAFKEEDTTIILDEKQALTRALEESKPGDLIIIFFEKYEELVSLVEDKSKKFKENSLEKQEEICLA